MAKKPVPTREELQAQLDALDNATEVATLKAQIARLTAENGKLISERRTLTADLSRFRQDFDTIRKAVRIVDKRHAPLDTSLVAVANATARLGLAHVRVGIQKGTHDPLTGLEYQAETRPAPDLTSTANARVSQGDLAKIFPELNGPEQIVAVDD